VCVCARARMRACVCVCVFCIYLSFTVDLRHRAHNFIFFLPTLPFSPFLSAFSSYRICCLLVLIRNLSPDRSMRSLPSVLGGLLCACCSCLFQPELIRLSLSAVTERRSPMVGCCCGFLFCMSHFL